jgi:hypothetical protein
VSIVLVVVVNVDSNWNNEFQRQIISIQTRLLKARSVTTWGEYLEKVKEILQSIDECAKEVKDIETSILVRVFKTARVDN